MQVNFGFVVDAGQVELSFIVIVKFVLSQFHSVNGGKSSSLLRENSGSSFVFDRIDSDIQNRYRYCFSLIPKSDQDSKVSPETISDIGYSDSLACFLAVANLRNTTEEENIPLVLCSCAFAPQDKKYGLTKLSITKVTEETSRSKDSLYNKWLVAKNHNALALILQDRDCQLLCENFDVRRVSLCKNVFKKLIEEYKDGNYITPIVSCKSDQIQLLMQSLSLQKSMFKITYSSVIKKIVMSVFVFLIFIGIVIIHSYWQYHYKKLQYQFDELQYQFDELQSNNDYISTEYNSIKKDIKKINLLKNPSADDGNNDWNGNFTVEKDIWVFPKINNYVFYSGSKPNKVEYSQEIKMHWNKKDLIEIKFGGCGFIKYKGGNHYIEIDFLNRERKSLGSDPDQKKIVFNTNGYQSKTLDLPVDTDIIKFTIFSDDQKTYVDWGWGNPNFSSFDNLFLIAK